MIKKGLLGIFSFCIFVPSLFAVTPSSKILLKEYLEKSIDIEKENVSKEVSELTLKQVEEKRNWDLDASATYVDYSQESSSFFTVSPIKTTVVGLDLSRETIWGGTFKFTNLVSNLRGSSTFGALKSGEAYNLTQGISYSQDLGSNLFGKDSYLELEVAQLDNEVSQFVSNRETEKKMQTFYNILIDMRLGKTLLSLQQDALKRAEKRKDFISKRVRDGLRENVDLYQAEMSLLTKKEDVESEKRNLGVAIEKASLQVQRKVTKDEIELFNFSPSDSSLKAKGSLEKNLDYLQFDKKLKSINGEVKRADRAVTPDINFTVGYETNDYDPRLGRVLENGNLVKGNDEVTLALTLSMPLGQKVEKLELAKKRANAMLAKREKEEKMKRLLVEEKTLFARLASLKININLVAKRNEIAKKSLKAYNELYKRGKADVDQVIQAEEGLITTQLTFARYLADKEKVAANIFVLYGELNNFLLEVL